MDNMPPINEKEYNGILLDQLSLLERIQSGKTSEEKEEIIEREKRFIERKLYQSPLLTTKE